MRLIVNKFRDCYHNIASEEFLCDNLKDDIFLLYINRPSIIVGRNQNTYGEINQHFVEEKGIDIVRRLSGGGAVYHDKNNLNFSFITSSIEKPSDELFREFTTPVIKALKTLGVNAEFSGRNDIVVDGKKFSGNAQFKRNGRTVVHGTILFDCDLSVLSQALSVNEIKFVDKSIKSVKSRVTNIKPYMDEEYSMDEFVKEIIKNVEKNFSKFTHYEYTKNDIERIDKLVEEKYHTKSWNYGKSPEFKFTTRFRYEKGIVEVNVNASSGIIKEIKICGDFFGKNPNLIEVEDKLINVEFSPNEMKKALKLTKLSDYIGSLNSEDFVDYIFKTTKSI